MKKVLANLEHIFTIVALILYSGAMLTLFITGGANEGEYLEIITDNTLIKQVFILVYLLTILCLTCRWQKTLYVAGKNVCILLFILLTFFSVYWSTAPDKTISGAIALFGTNLFGLYLGSRYTLKQQLMLLAEMSGIIIFLSLVLIVLMPKYGIMGGIHTGAWRGVFSHKNGLGKWMVSSTAIFLIQSANTTKKDIKAYLGLFCSIGMSIASRSSSSIVNIIILVAIFIVLRTWRWRYEIMIPASIAIMTFGSFVAVWFNSNSSVVFSIFGKDSKLSGRGDLWALAWDMVLKHPWLGYGYSAFWQESSKEAIEIWQSIGWSAPNAHNGFIDLALNLGFAGVIIIFFSLMNTFARSFICLRYTKTIDEFWLLIFMAYLILTNLTESGLMDQNNIFTVIYIGISYGVIISTSSRTRSLVYGDVT